MLFGAALMAFLFWSAARVEPIEADCKYDSVECKASSTDSLLVDGIWEGRQAGLVNLEKFKDLASRSPYFSGCDRKVNTVTFKATVPQLYFGSDARLKNCTNMGVTVRSDDNSFTTKVTKKNGVEYIYIPYHILASVASYSN